MTRPILFALIFALPVAAIAQQAVFTDTFASSTTNKTSVPGGTPTASSTSYDIASTKAATGGSTGPIISAGHFRISLNGSTTGGFVESQALFAATPVTLVTVNDYINLTYTFTNTTASLLAGGTTSYLFNGFYNSGGSVPVAGGLANSGLGTSTFSSGNCANWQGYVSRISNGGTSQAYTRPQQTGASTSAAQDLIGNNLGSGAYTSPTGLVFDAPETVALPLTSGATYTVSYTIALTAAGTITVTNNLYSGTGIGGTLVFSQTNTASGTTNLTQSFDGFSIGVRNSGSSFNPTMDISKIAIVSGIFGTPGPSFDVTGGGAGCPGSAFLVGLNGSAAVTNVYYLYTNGVADGAVAPVTGTGSAISFGPQMVAATYTVLASNTIDGFTGTMIGDAVITAFTAPTITAQPSALSVANNSAGVFSVFATGGSLNFQWYRNGVGLANAGEFSGVTTSNLLINPVSGADVASQAQGYYCIITNSCGQMTITTTNSLTLRTPANLVWQGGNPNTNWDLNTTPNFTNSAGAAVVFHAGDNVTFDDSSTNPVVTVAGSFVAPGVMTENASQGYFFTVGSAPLIGNGSLVMNGSGGSGTLTISNANAYTGGSTLNSGTVVVRTYNNPLGTGPINMAGGTLDVPQAGSASAGLSNDVHTVAASTLEYDVTGTFALVLFGPLSGNPGQTLTIYNINATTTLSRIRLYDPFTNNANILFNSAGTSIDMAPYLGSDNQVYNGVISGNYGRFVPRGGGYAIFNNSLSTFNDGNVSGSSGYSLFMSSGNVGFGADSISSSPPTIDSGPVGTGNIGINVGVEGGNCNFLAYAAPHTVGNPVIYTSATNTVTVSFVGTNALTFSGTFSLNGADSTGGTNRILDVTNGMMATLSGVVGDASLGCGLTKSGGGTLVLGNVNTYTGPTLVSDGKLWVNGQIDVGGVNITNGTLGGNGTILGPVTNNAPGSIAPGTTAIGTLTINNNLFFGGNGQFKLNKSLSPSNDLVVVTGTLTNTGAGTITVTNLGPALAVGDRFVLFSETVSNGTALHVAGGGMNWTNYLAVDGSIQALSVVSTTASYPTNITFSFNGTTLNIGWPQTHLGWILQSQTNSLSVGLTSASNTWFDIPSTSSGTNATMTVNPNNPTVFFRIRHP